MSSFSTDELLELLDRWYDEHKDDKDYTGQERGLPRNFFDFDELLGKDLSDIDLSEFTIRTKAELFAAKAPIKMNPPWISKNFLGTAIGGLNLIGAVISLYEEGKITDLSNANLEGAALGLAILEGANLTGACLKSAYLVEARLAHSSLANAQLNDADLGRARLDEAGLQGAQLHNADLQYALLRHADLREAQLNNANLLEANLQGAIVWFADLRGVNFENSRLQGTDFHEARICGADFKRAKLQNSNLYGVELSGAKLEEVDWSDGYRLDESAPREAEPTYRGLKNYYINSGQYDLAGEFHYREMLTKRRNIWNSHSNSPMRAFRLRLDSLALYFLQLSCGYGERPSWVVGWSLMAWLAFAFVYFLGQATVLGDGYSSVHFLRALFDSALPFASFTPPGLPEVNEEVVKTFPTWANTVAIVQGIIAYVLLALFLVTFVRKISRS